VPRQREGLRAPVDRTGGATSGARQAAGDTPARRAIRNRTRARCAADQTGWGSGTAPCTSSSRHHRDAGTSLRVAPTRAPSSGGSAARTLRRRTRPWRAATARRGVGGRRRAERRALPARRESPCSRSSRGNNARRSRAHRRGSRSSAPRTPPRRRRSVRRPTRRAAARWLLPRIPARSRARARLRRRTGPDLRDRRTPQRQVPPLRAGHSDRARRGRRLRARLRPGSR